MAKPVSTPLLELIRRVCQDPRVPDSPDQELFRRFRDARDEAAFAALLRRHGPMVLDVCRAVLGNHADAEDAFQATFLLLARKAGAIRKAASVSSWLHGVAYRTALKARAASARRRRHEARAAGQEAAPEPDALTWREVRQVLHEELARLAPRHRAALVLCYLEGQTQDEAASQLGLPKGTLKGHLERGRALLRARLVRRGLGPAAVLAAAAWPPAGGAASPPASLLASTAQAAVVIATGGPAAGGVSPPVAALTQAMAKSMLLRQVAVAALLVLAVAGSGVGLALATRGRPAAEADRVAQRPAAPERPRPRPEPAAKAGSDTGQPTRSLAGHEERVTSVAYSPDGRWIATAAWDGTARLWDAQSGKQVRRLDVPAPRDYSTAHLTRILFAPDNELVIAALLAAPNEPGVIVWSRHTGERVRDFPGGYGSVAVSPDGRCIACGGWGRGADVNFGVVRLFELATGNPVRELRGHQSRIESLAFSPDGATLIAQVGVPRPPLAGGRERGGLDGAAIRAWDVATGKERRSTRDGLWRGPQVATSPDGRTLAAGASLHENATGGLRVRLVGHSQEVAAVAFGPDGRTVATGSMDGTVRLWDPHSAKELARLGQETPRFSGRGWVLAVAFSPDGRTLVSAGLDRTAHLWDVHRITGRRRVFVERSPAQLEADWQDLAGDAGTGFRALGRLAASPQGAVPFLGKRLEEARARAADTRRVERLIADLDDPRFRVREQATKDLAALGDFAAPSLRKALAGRPSAELKRRLETLLERVEATGPSAETARQIRAVEALEAIGTPAARQFLAKLGQGPGETRLVQEARASAARLAKRPPAGS